MPEIVASGLEVGFGAGSGRTAALQGVSLAVAPGVLTIVTGPSGSGKTTLLSVLGALIKPDRGQVLVDGRDIEALSEAGRAEFRRHEIGFVFQAFRLMRPLSALENVRMSLAMRGVPRTEARARRALEEVGLAEKSRLKPDALSGGEKQRVAIARALAHDPPIILADEPTSSLDRASGLRVAELLGRLVAPGRSILAVSHDDRLLPYAGRVVRLEDGRIVGDERC